MNHRPFEDWILEEADRTPHERQELEDHLRACPRCSALSASGSTLRLGQMVPPRSGFVTRFSARLARQQAADRRRRSWGAVVLVAAGLAVLGIWAAPYLRTVAASPVEWFTGLISYLVYLISSGRALLGLSRVMVRVAPDLMPGYAWMMLVSGMAALGLIWTVSLWRLTRASGGVRP